MPAAGVVLIVAVVLIVLALVYFLVSTIVALRQITSDLDDAIAGVGGIIEKSAPVAEVVKDINANLDAGVDLLEGLLVKKAGLVDSMGLIEGLYPGAAAEGLRNFPDSRTIKAPRISEVYTKGTLTLARLGREAPIAVASPAGPVLRNVEGGSLDARSLYPEERQSRPKRFPRSPVIGTGAPLQYPPSEQRGGTTPDEAEIRDKGPWAETSAEGIVPAELGGSDAPREMLAEDRELGSSVLGETTASDEPATGNGIDPDAGDEADATSDGGPEPPEGAEPDLKDAAAPPRQVDLDDRS
jgi:hypothetical protein